MVEPGANSTGPCGRPHGRQNSHANPWIYSIALQSSYRILRSSRNTSKLEESVDDMDSDAETYCPSWHLEGVNTDHQYTEQPARLIRVFGRRQNVPALLLSPEVASAIQNAICHGKMFRQLEQKSKAQIAEIECRLDDATGHLSSVRDALEQHKRREALEADWVVMPISDESTVFVETVSCSMLGLSSGVAVLVLSVAAEAATAEDTSFSCVGRICCSEVDAGGVFTLEVSEAGGSRVSAFVASFSSCASSIRFFADCFSKRCANFCAGL